LQLGRKAIKTYPSGDSGDRCLSPSIFYTSTEIALLFGGGIVVMLIQKIFGKFLTALSCPCALFHRRSQRFFAGNPYLQFFQSFFSWFFLKKIGA
jgi:hypothetical protein